jgi:hypothetical protein
LKINLSPAGDTLILSKNIIMYFCQKNMETLIIKSKTKSNARLLSALARKLGDRVEVQEDRQQTCLAIESAWAKDWLTPEEDEVWKDL